MIFQCLYTGICIVCSRDNSIILDLKNSNICCYYVKYFVNQFASTSIQPRATMLLFKSQAIASSIYCTVKSSVKSLSKKILLYGIVASLPTLICNKVTMTIKQVSEMFYFPMYMFTLNCSLLSLQ